MNTWPLAGISDVGNTFGLFYNAGTDQVGTRGKGNWFNNIRKRLEAIRYTVGKSLE